jgi:hypothetical protein
MAEYQVNEAGAAHRPDLIDKHPHLDAAPGIG